MQQAKTPKIELKLNITEERPKKEAHVIKAGKRHLVCEYDGLVFKQPREESAPRSENTPANPVAQQRAAGAAGGPPAQRGSSGTPQAAATPLQQPGNAAGSLETLVAGWFEAEAQAGGSVEVAAALRDLCQRFCGGGSLDCAPLLPAGGSSAAAASPLRSSAAAAVAGAVNEEVEHADYQVDLEARKAGLRTRLEGYEKEMAAWEALVQEAEQYSGEPGEAAAALPTTPESDAAEPADIAELRQMHADLHRHLSMQAEGLHKLVSDVEELVDRANRTAHSLQADYHQEKFRAFPHVDSPARLIKEIVKPPARRGAAAQQQ